MPRTLPDDRLDRVQRGGDVLVGQLALQRQGGGRDDDPLARVRREPDQGRGEVAQRLAGPGPGLHQQVPARVEGVRDGIGHLDLAGPLAAADPVDGRGQHLAVADVRVGLGRRRVTDARRVAGQAPAAERPAVTAYCGELAGQGRD